MHEPVRAASGEDEDGWISISDMMAGLMMVFLFIAIVYIRPWLDQKEKIEEIVATFQASEDALFAALEAEFADDLSRWDAELDRASLALKFKSPDILFAPGREDIRQPFKEILGNFFPRYLDILLRFQDDIEEVRIEGHTSSEWSGTSDVNAAYLYNMRLSQARTRSVLDFCLRLPTSQRYRQWVVAHLTANGLSSGRLLYTSDGSEDAARSRRVEFRVRTKAKERVVKIIQTLGKGT